jgi:hypothetical protein
MEMWDLHGSWITPFLLENNLPYNTFWNKNKGDQYVLKFDITWDKERIVWGLLFTINLIKNFILF